MRPFVFLLCISLIFTSCLPTGRIHLEDITIGMTKEQVRFQLHRNPDNVIGSKQYPSGLIEVLQYSRYDPFTNELLERYWLYFLDNTLKQWGRPGDWQKEADQIYEIRVK